MVFSSNVFLFLFLPLFLATYYLAPQRARAWVIVAGSYLFYAWWRVDFLLLFAGVTLFNYVVGLRVAAHGARTAGARRWLVGGIVGNLAVLGYFKYANFGVESFNALLVSAGMQPFSWSAVILPIGISFYVFQCLSYVADVYRGDAAPARSFSDFAAFIALFPQLIAGPVLRYKDLDDQLRARTHTVDKFAEGAVRFMQGFVKKVFIADSVAPLVATGFALENPTTGDAWLTVLAYTVQLYFDFSGYSDMAIGLGLMMGFRFIENFNQPYIAQSITEFWRRWHMSLSAWLRDYLYIALGGNRGGTGKTYRNLFLTMLLGGLWHGANWTFVIWGAWHGAILAVERALGVRVPAGTEPDSFRPHRWALTFLLVVLGWVMFRAETVGDAMTLYAAMFAFDGAGLSDAYASDITRLQIATLALAFVVIAVRGWQVRNGGQTTISITATPGADVGAGNGGLSPISPGTTPAFAVVSPAAAAIWLPLFALSVLKLSAQSYSPFLYFQF
jgi:alginate O-acetyltransferase complex protein AlgI